ncbi:MAG: pyridoxamine 5'-phosphate oxidase family protein [Rhizobiales bacterium]|nr:pyridoxamine 5'-phosphate oxidase family protein [Hyphomicrobiales bacterium]
MPNFPNQLSDRFIQFIKQQHMFFVATAAPDGQVNLSPKGLDTLRVLSAERIVWLSLSGSGNETAAHLREANRITMMFCAFEGRPLILRVYGTAATYHPRDAQWAELIGLFPKLAGSRQIYDVSIKAIQTSCGSGIPYYDFRCPRGETELEPFYDKMGEDGVEAYWARKNQMSIDGKPTGIFPTGHKLETTQ